MTEEKKECKCKTCELLGKFLFLTGAVFLGTLLALLLAHAINKPKFPPCHRGMFMGPRAGIERRLPPPIAQQGRMRPEIQYFYGQRHEFNRGINRHHKRFKKMNAPIPQMPQQNTPVPVKK